MPRRQPVSRCVSVTGLRRVPTGNHRPRARSLALFAALACFAALASPGVADAATGANTVKATSKVVSVSGAGQRLTWAPPAGYAKFPVTKVTATSSLTIVDARGGDVRVQLAADHAVGPVTIQNCRNAVLIGGRITVLASAKVNGYDQRALMIKNCTGTVHVEGLQITGNVLGSQADAIAAQSPKAVLQIQNVRADGLRGGQSGNHADVFQPWGGLRAFRIDRLTGSSNYQGITTTQSTGLIGSGTIKHANITSSGVTPVDKGGYFVWVNCNDRYPLSLSDVYVSGRSGRTLGASVWPRSDAPSCASKIAGNVATWPGRAGLTGGVRSGTPPTGDFVPAGSVGLGYTSPGYL